MRCRTSRTLCLVILVASIGSSACRREGRTSDRAQLEAAQASITAGQLAEHIRVLASDEFEGRLPGTAGEEKTLVYLRERFEAVGLEPGNAGSWFQDVPLVSIAASPGARLTVRKAGRVERFAYGDEIMVWTKRVLESVDLRDSELVFVGYGTVAPEYGWDDYADVDVRGKTVVMLVNDPGYATEDPGLFNGRAMTYYGRWTYKYEEAARQGAAAALIVHETAPAAYGWGVVQGSWTGPQFDMVTADDNMSRVKVEGWITLETAQRIFEIAGHDFEQIKVRATAPDFRPLPLGLTASLSLRNKIERSNSNNFFALLPGSDRADEYVIYMAHWDHLGRDPGLEGDQIYNGAVDNASGTAALLELAEAFASLERRPRRSLVFFATTAEEQGLLGSAYYAAHPIYPFERTVAAINIDGLNVLGPMRDVVVVGYGNSELDDYLSEAAATQDRVLVPDPEAEKGFFYRSDHFPLARQGVPALYTDVGSDHSEHGKEWTQRQKDEWTARRYHKPSDEYDPSWDLTGAVDDVRLFFRVGYRLANEARFPNWREGTEFKAARDALMASAR